MAAQKSGAKGITQGIGRTRRSLLFMPGDSWRKIEKATDLEVDSIIMDLEDGVTPSKKAQARGVIVNALEDLTFGPRERLIRINPVQSEFAQRDLEETVGAQPDGYVVPKVELPEDLLSVDHYLTQEERRNGWPPNGLRLLALVETARGILNLAAIAAATKRLDALLFGAEDLAGSVGFTRTKQGNEILFARSQLVLAAAAYDLAAIDTVYVDLSDVEGLEAECRVAVELGFSGKMAIHPRQASVINRAFRPSQASIVHAERVIRTFEQKRKEGFGVFEMDGKMVDMPMVRAAQRTLGRAGDARAGKSGSDSGMGDEHAP